MRKYPAIKLIIIPIVLVFIVALILLVRIPSHSPADLNATETCRDALNSRIGAIEINETIVIDDTPPGLSDRCFNETNQPVIEELKGAEPGDEIKKTRDGFEVMEVE